MVPPVLGRAADFLESADGDWIDPARVLASLGEVLEDGRFQVVQDGGGCVKVSVISPRDISKRLRQAVSERVSHLLGMSTFAR